MDVSQELEELRRSLERQPRISLFQFKQLMSLDIAWHGRNEGIKDEQDALTSWKQTAQDNFFKYWAKKLR